MKKSVFGIAEKSQLIDRFLNKKTSINKHTNSVPLPNITYHSDIPEAFTRFDRHPNYERMMVPKVAAERLKIENPFFRAHEGVAGATTRINGREFINFSSYNYLGLSGHPLVNKAAKEAIERYGTSVSASRLVAGERPVQRELEEALAEFYEVEDCIVFVSGHATNVTTIGSLFGPKDLIIHDSLIHNSVLEGIKLSGSTRRSFSHNQHEVLDHILTEIRGQFERVLIIVEGLYSMDGDMPDLPALVEIKRRHKAFLMVDEAHGLGVLGATGKGLREHYNVAGTDVDIWMGTLSKSLASCGGYIAGERALIENLKYAAPGFVYSVGIPPSAAAAGLAALKILQKEPGRVQRLQEKGRYFLKAAADIGINTGLSQGYAITPAITGSSLKAIKISNWLCERGYNVLPIVYPAVEEKSARLRFFISNGHTESQIDQTLQALKAGLGA